MTGDTDETLERVDQGLNVLFAAEVADEILDAVDVEAILAEEPAEDPVDVERLVAALGRPLGTLLVHRVVDGSGAGGLAKRAVGSKVGGRVVGQALEVVVEAVDFEAAATELAAVDPEAPRAGLEAVVEAALGEEFAADETVDAAATEIDVSGPDDAENE